MGAWLLILAWNWLPGALTGEGGPRGWVVEVAGRFAEPGECHSAARVGSRMAVACQSGVWWGEPHALRLLLPCGQTEGAPNRVVRLDERRAAAAGPCGLFTIDERGRLERLTLPDPPLSLAADGRGSLLVVAGEGLWWIEVDSGRRRLLESVDGEEAAALEVAVAGGFSWVRSRTWRRVAESDGGVFEPPAPGALGWPLDGDQVWWAGRDGRLWLADGATIRVVSDLGLAEGEGLVALRPTGHGFWLASSERWFLVEKGQLVEGWLPPVPESPVPVDRAPDGSPPAQVAGAAVYRLRWRRLPPGAACATAGLSVPQPPASAAVPVLPRAWPRLTLTAAGGRSRIAGWPGAATRTLQLGDGFELRLGLSWNLGAAPDILDSERALLRRERAADWSRRLEQVRALAAARRRLCRLGGLGSLDDRELRRRAQVLAGWPEVLP